MKQFYSAAMFAALTVSLSAQTAPVFTAIPSDSKYGNGAKLSVALLDLTNDGKLNMLYSDNNGTKVKTYSVNSSNIYDIDGGKWGKDLSVGLKDASDEWMHSVVCPIDYNADGRIDFIIASGNGDGKSALYETSGGQNPEYTAVGNFPTLNVASVGSGYDNSRYTGLIVAADFNYDGYPDIVVQGKDGAYIWWNDNGSGNFIQGEKISSLYDGTVAVGDYNNDGLVDIVTTGIYSNNMYNVEIAKNKGDKSFETVYVTDPDKVNDHVGIGAMRGQILFVDLDGDGDLDIFLTGWGRTTNLGADYARNPLAQVLRNNGNDAFELWDKGFAAGLENSGAAWADINGDGIPDVVAVGDTKNDLAPDFRNVVFYGGSESYTVAENAIAGSKGKHGSGATVHIGDVDRDGIVEIFLAGFMGWNGDQANIEGFKVNASAADAQADEDLGLKAEPYGGDASGKTVISWNSKGGAVRYNYYVKTKDGKIFMAVPADPATGALRQSNIDAALASDHVVLNVAPENIAEYGVQTIGADTRVAPFSTATEIGDISSGISEIIGDEADAPVEYYDLHGRKIAEPSHGLFIVRQGNKVSKVIR